MSADITVVKLGGELLEDAAAIRRAAGALVELAARRSLVVVHGGGRAVDAELRARGQAARFVDGLRVTDEAALEAAVSVLAGRNNTALVAAIHADGGRAVGLTARIGDHADGALLNVNADTLAGHLAAALHAGELIVAGTTPGVLNGEGEPIAELDVDSVDEMTASCAAHSGMVAKLAACRHAVLAGVEQVAIVDGRAAGGFAGARGTRVVGELRV